MKTRQKTKIEERNPESRVPHSAWRLDIQLDRQHIQRDLDALVSIPLPITECPSLVLFCANNHRCITESRMDRPDKSRTRPPTGNVGTYRSSHTLVERREVAGR